MTPRHASAEPFFLATNAGERFCLYHPAQGTARAALVYLHPFAEEMNKTRRVAALQARALAQDGIAVLQLDLQGCGDSDGDFGDARWEQWKRDVDLASEWLRRRTGLAPGLWGLRLGALLALDCARDAAVPPERLLLWQPVLQGATFMTQFLRLRVAGAMLDEEAPASGTRELRAMLAGGEMLEVAGYQLAPELAASIDALDAAAMAPACPMTWIEVVATPERPAPPPAARAASAWGKADALHTVAAPMFWSTQEIEEAPALIALTSSLMRSKP